MVAHTAASARSVRRTGGSTNGSYLLPRQLKGSSTVQPKFISTEPHLAACAFPACRGSSGLPTVSSSKRRVPYLYLLYSEFGISKT